MFRCLGVSSARGDSKDQDASGAANNAKREAAPSSSYGPPSSSQDTEPKPVYGPPSSPQSYSKSIPAAAIRNVETVAVTKTITPVVTKTTTYNTHSEPALSIGHVQGYSQSAQGSPKIAPVQFQTQYTSYLNPTVGVNGPVTYTGPAVVFAGGYSVPLTALSLSSGGSYTLGSSSSSGNGSPAPVYGPPSSESSGSSAPSSTYGPPNQSAGTPLGQYSMNIPQYVAFRQAGSASAPMSLLNMQQLQQLRALSSQRQALAAMASRLSPVAIRAPSSSPYALYQRPISPVALATAASSPLGAAALRYQYQQQQLPLSSAVYQRHQQASQPTTYVQTYAMPSVSFTQLRPVTALNNQNQNQQASMTKAISH